MKISEKTLKNISQLSKLGINDDTKKKLITELESILEMVNKMNEVNTVDVFPSCGDETNAFGAAFLLNAMHTKKLPNFWK